MAKQLISRTEKNCSIKLVFTCMCVCLVVSSAGRCCNPCFFPFFLLIRLPVMCKKRCRFGKDPTNHWTDFKKTPPQKYTKQK